ncbi:uncharacterized protein LOC141619924 [Silene latifolia]|uniref:uncharacterized protein LOC141619924 n=1 Tax=Silene latifolia TaxID=37657 RepID=UPI003D783AC8
MTNDGQTSKPTFSPAYSVSNIKNYVPIILEIENVHYASWAELFLNTTCAFDVLDHIAPPKDAVIKKDAGWDRLDAIVKQWIYSTIFIDLLHTILEPGATAQQTWDRLKDIFNDNQNSRTVTLEQQFSNIHMDNYSNVSAYCQALKMIADQLSNVGSPVPETRLVLQIVTHLSEGYDSVATIIQQSDPLPSFYKARSMLTMEEARKAKSAATPSDNALVATSSNSKPTYTSNNGGNSSNSNNNYKGKGNRHHKGNYRGKNQGGGNNGGSNKQTGRQQTSASSPSNWAWVPLPQWPATSQQGWTAPPCPYPTSGWTPSAANIAPGILGPRPQQAFLAQPGVFGMPPGALVPTDLAAVMQSLNLQQPDDNYYMDTGASSHMNSNNGNLVSYSPLSGNRGTVVGNGNTIPIRGVGNTTFPFPAKNIHLNNVLHVPHLIKNLISVRKFTVDNFVSVEFDPFGFTVKDLKTGTPLLRSHCLFVIRVNWHKFKANGDLERYKARLVVNGRSQQVGVDCEETFSPVVKSATIRTVLSLAVSKNWSIHQLDVKNAFLHGHLTETVYMHQPPGFRDRSQPDHVCLLKKSLYGLKQAPRAWYQRFATYVSTIGFTQSKSDNSLFIYNNEDQLAYLLLYVDDIILATSSESLRVNILSQLQSEFSMTDLGPLNYFLGIAVVRHPRGLFLHQSKYAQEIITRANMSSCKPALTPVDTQSKLSANSGKPFSDPVLYRSLAGALQYLTFTRPDISYGVQQICLFMHDPREEHFSALKRIIRYIQGITHYGLHLTRLEMGSLTAYTDADWGGCPDSRRSTSGYCVYLAHNLISWSSKRQPTVSRSSSEAEYRGVANVVAESCWLRNLLLELHCPIRHTSIVYCDNVSAIYLSGNPVNHQRTKHIELDIHFVREKVAINEVQVRHVPSRYQYADIFTKGLPKILFNDFRSSLNVGSPPVSTEGVY